MDTKCIHSIDKVRKEKERKEKNRSGEFRRAKASKAERSEARSVGSKDNAVENFRVLLCGKL